MERRQAEAADELHSASARCEGYASRRLQGFSAVRRMVGTANQFTVANWLLTAVTGMPSAVSILIVNALLFARTFIRLPRRHSFPPRISLAWCAWKVCFYSAPWA